MPGLIGYYGSHVVHEQRKSQVWYAVYGLYLVAQVKEGPSPRTSAAPVNVLVGMQGYD